MYATLVLANLILTAMVFLGFGLWAIANPEAMAVNSELQIIGPAGAIALRAIYGGFLTGAGALFLYFPLVAKLPRLGLVAILVIVGSIFSARLAGSLLAGVWVAPHTQYLVIEGGSLVITLALLYWGQLQDTGQGRAGRPKDNSRIN